MVYTPNSISRITHIHNSTHHFELSTSYSEGPGERMSNTISIGNNDRIDKTPQELSISLVSFHLM